MKKTLALVLALAMVFSSITVAFAEGTIGAEAQIAADLGMLKGETGTVDAAYTATAPTRLQAAIMFLRLKGLEAEALAFTGEDNFVDGNIAWAEGSNLLAYLKANPQLGWVGDGTNFNPNGVLTAQAYYKVMLEALGYKQTTPEVVGDFVWADVLTFAASKGLSAVASVTNFTVNDLAIATVEALKTNVKDTEAALYKSVVSEEAAVAAGLVVVEAPAAVAVAVDEAVAVGNAVVEVTFEEDVDAAAAGNIENYAIEGLAINAVVVTGSDLVRLETAAMTSGKLYKLTVGEKTVQFTGVAKVSGGPEIEKVVSEDVEEVVITFTKNIDFATGTDIANYSISGVDVVAAEVDGADVILTTEGLKNKTKYTVKVTNVKSVDGVAKKSDSDSFTSRYDLVAPKITTADPETNQRLVVVFSEKVDETSASNIGNYTITVDETDGAELEILEVKYIKTGDDKEKKVEIITEPMEKREDYELSIVNVGDKRKVSNVMTRPATKDFEGKGEDEKEPTWNGITVLSPTTILVTFVDDSRLDEASALDINNYTLEDLDIDSIETVDDDYQLFRALLTVEEMETGKSYDLTIVDVLDEFGNALKETKKSAKGVSGNFASSMLKTAVATGENKVLLTFAGEVDESSAENLANYSIDEGVGSPTKATLKTATTVELEVNDLINGYDQYDIIVDGVKDLAGNELYYKIKVTTNAGTPWDTVGPEVEDADILNNEVVALSFDEKVQYAEGTVMQLAVNYDEEADTHEGLITLTAKDYADDETTIEFSGTTMSASENYTVFGFVYDGGTGITDYIGNAVKVANLKLFSFDYVADDAEGPEVDSYEQTNGYTFEVTMNRWVKVKAGQGTQDLGDVEFTVSADEDVLTFVSDTKLVENEDYDFDFRVFVEDYHGNAAQNADDTDVTTLSGEFTDEEAPYIDEVVAKDRWTIKITFSEHIDSSTVAAADFELKNYDTDKVIGTTVYDKDADDEIIELVLDKPLEARYEYELTLKDKNLVQDMVGKDNTEAESFYFDGTNLANKDKDHK